LPARRRPTSCPAVEFDRRHRVNGVRATAVHPGGIATELGRYAYSEPGALQKRVDGLNAEHAAAGKPLFRLKTIPQGAATSVWAGVVAPAEAVGGRYCELPRGGTPGELRLLGHHQLF
jgi:NAD(P)-dependent dehydrogenase (short-subunit alcohol dehydrogenase family)